MRIKEEKGASKHVNVLRVDAGRERKREREDVSERKKQQERREGGGSLELKIRGTITFSYSFAGEGRHAQAITRCRIINAWCIITLA